MNIEGELDCQRERPSADSAVSARDGDPAQLDDAVSPVESGEKHKSHTICAMHHEQVRLLGRLNSLQMALGRPLRDPRRNLGVTLDSQHQSQICLGGGAEMDAHSGEGARWLVSGTVSAQVTPTRLSERSVRFVLGRIPDLR